MVLVAGTTAIDTIQTPDSAPRECIGGSAVHFAYAAALFGPVRIVSIAGDDFPPDALRRLEARGIDTAGIRIAPAPPDEDSQDSERNEAGQELDHANLLIKHAQRGCACLIVPRISGYDGRPAPIQVLLTSLHLSC